MYKCFIVVIMAIVSLGCSHQKKTIVAKTFTNPLLDFGPDPYSYYKDGYYYYTHTLQDKLVIWKTKNLADLRTAEKTTVWTPPAGTMYSKELWAPQIQFIRGKWYMYFCSRRWQ